MSHWAEIDENNVVLRVTVGDNNEPDEGYQWLIDNLGGTWIKASYNTYGGVHLLGGTPLRKNYPTIGYTYDETRDAFIPPQLYPSFVLDEETCQWKNPIPKPEATETTGWEWNEATLSWEPFTKPDIQ